MVVWNWNKVTASCDPNRFVKLILPAILGPILGDICISYSFSMINLESCERNISFFSKIPQDHQNGQNGDYVQMFFWSTIALQSKKFGI